MQIVIQLGEGLKSRYDDKVLLPQIKVSSSLPLSVYGLYDNKPNCLELKREEAVFTASFFLHENITAHIHTGNFNLFVTNTRNFIACLITNEMTAFTTTQELTYSQEREVRLSDMLMNDFIVIEDEQTTTIETLSFEGKDTEKIGSI
jgi:hypothetical protein